MSTLELNHPIEAMKFRLVYDGPLPPEKRGWSDLKQDIRRKMHHQLRELIRTHPAFHYDGKNITTHVQQDKFYEKVYGQFTFAALVDEPNGRSCYLDILLLRRAGAGGVWAGGDIDNRIKTLLDGLCIPPQASHIPAIDIPKENENPFYCLLQDDKLITGFSVRTDRLLTSKDEKNEEGGSNYARAVIDVSINVSKVPWINMPFLAD